MPVKITYSKKLKDLLKGKTLAEVKSNKNLNKIGEFSVETIYKRTKDGKGLDGKLKKLSDNYIDWRKGKSAWFTNKSTGKIFKTTNSDYIKKPKLGEFGTPAKSNLTLSGKMLKSMVYKIFKSKVSLTLSGKHSKGLTNKQLGEYVQETRPFFGLTKKEEKLVGKKFTELVRLIVRRFNR